VVLGLDSWLLPKIFSFFFLSILCWEQLLPSEVPLKDLRTNTLILTLTLTGSAWCVCVCVFT